MSEIYEEESQNRIRKRPQTIKNTAVLSDISYLSIMQSLPLNLNKLLVKYPADISVSTLISFKGSSGDEALGKTGVALGLPKEYQHSSLLQP